MLGHIFVVIFLPLIINADVSHFQDMALNSMSDFNVTQITTLKSKTHCSSKCSIKKNYCSAFIYNEETQECKIGQVHPQEVICNNGGQELISVKSGIFGLVPQYALFQATTETDPAFYSLEGNLKAPANGIPDTGNWMIELHWVFVDSMCKMPFIIVHSAIIKLVENGIKILNNG